MSLFQSVPSSVLRNGAGPLAALLKHEGSRRPAGPERGQPLFPRTAARGLTLLELVVVLGILALLAGVTIQSLEPIADQARYEATVQTLEAMERAIYQEQPVSADRVRVRGFIADMGRLPRAVGDDPLWQSAELWDREASEATLRPFSVQPLGMDPEIAGLNARVAAGWNGPYLQPPRDGRLRDGWGRPLAFGVDGAALLIGEPLVTVRSQGSDGLWDSPEAGVASTYAADLPLIPPRFDSRLSAVIDFQLMERTSTGLAPATIDEGSRLYVFVLGPIDGVPGRIFPPIGGYDASHSSATESLLIPSELGDSPSSLTPGPRTLVTWIAGGTWPELSMTWSDERTVVLFPGMNVIQVVKPAAAEVVTPATATPATASPDPSGEP